MNTFIGCPLRKQNIGEMKIGQGVFLELETVFPFYTVLIISGFTHACEYLNKHVPVVRARERANSSLSLEFSLALTRDCSDECSALGAWS